MSAVQRLTDEGETQLGGDLLDRAAGGAQPAGGEVFVRLHERMFARVPDGPPSRLSGLQAPMV